MITFPIFRAMKIASERIQKQLGYSFNFTAQLIMAMKTDVSDGNEEIAAEMIVNGVEIAKIVAENLGGGPDAILEACRNMEIDYR